VPASSLGRQGPSACMAAIAPEASAAPVAPLLASVALATSTPPANRPWELCAAPVAEAARLVESLAPVSIIDGSWASLRPAPPRFPFPPRRVFFQRFCCCCGSCCACCLAASSSSSPASSSSCSPSSSAELRHQAKDLAGDSSLTVLAPEPHQAPLHEVCVAPVLSVELQLLQVLRASATSAGCNRSASRSANLNFSCSSGGAERERR